MKPPQRIQTGRLLLRKPRLDDAHLIFETYAQNPKVTRYLVWKPHKTIQETEQFLLARLHWNQGYMTEVLRTMIDWAFTQPEIFRVQAICDVENVASARVMEKAGMAPEGLLRRYVLHPCFRGLLLPNGNIR